MSVNSARNKIIIGLTGGIATGKSEAIEYLKTKDYYCIDSDLLVKELYETNDNLINFKKSIKALNYSDFIFEHKDIRLKLESIVHPLVLDKIDELIDISDTEYIIIDMPLLFEINYSDECDYTILIYADKETQIKRLTENKELSLKNALLRINAQMPIDEKLDMATYVIDNRRELKDMYKELDTVMKDIENDR